MKEKNMGSETVLVKDIMTKIEAFEKIDVEAPLCDALSILIKNRDKPVSADPFEKTIFVTDSSGEIVGKLSIFDFIRGLVPEPVRKKELSRAYYSMISTRALEVAEEVGEIQRSFAWLHSSFQDLVTQEIKKNVKDIMSPVHPLVDENDSINKAIYIIFKEHIRQPLVTRDNKVVGAVSIMDIYPELIKIADSCFL